MKNQPLKDRVYKLTRGKAPLNYILASKSSSLKPLLYFDGKENRAIRYARNQKSPFEDEQDGNVILEPIIFKDGFLRVPKENPVLQHFLSVHPAFGVKFEEVDKKRDAQQELETIELEADAISKAKDLSMEQLEVFTRLLLGRDPELVSVPEMKRDIMIFARLNPSEFLNAYENPELDFTSKVALFFDKKLLGLRNGGRDVHYNLSNNKKRMIAVPFGEDPHSAVAAYLKSDEGIESLKLLEKKIDSL